MKIFILSMSKSRQFLDTGYKITKEIDANKIQIIFINCYHKVFKREAHFCFVLIIAILHNLVLIANYCALTKYINDADRRQYVLHVVIWLPCQNHYIFCVSNGRWPCTATHFHQFSRRVHQPFGLSRHDVVLRGSGV